MISLRIQLQVNYCLKVIKLNFDNIHTCSCVYFLFELCEAFNINLISLIAFIVRKIIGL